MEPSAHRTGPNFNFENFALKAPTLRMLVSFQGFLRHLGGMPWTRPWDIVVLVPSPCR